MPPVQAPGLARAQAQVQGETIIPALCSPRPKISRVSFAEEEVIM